MVSGLFAPERVPFKAPVEVNALGWFDPLVTVNDATGIVANLILTSNLSYPQGRMGTSYFPMSEELQSATATSLAVDMAVLQPQLNCTSDVHEDISNTFRIPEEASSQRIVVFIPLPTNCGIPPNPNNITLDFDLTVL